MNIWQELGIDKTDDIRSIKRAYAKKLKQVRPDEKPDEFQRLHAAYKSAQDSAQMNVIKSSSQLSQEMLMGQDNLPLPVNQVTEDLETLVQDGNIEQSKDDGLDQRQQSMESIPADDLANQYLAQDEDRQRVEDADSIIVDTDTYADEIAHTMANVEKVISRLEGLYVESWSFLLESKYLLHEEFMGQLGHALLNRIAEYYNNKQHVEQGDFRINEQVLRYLNSLFHWNRYYYDFSHIIKNDYGLRLFHKLQNDDVDYTDKHQQPNGGVKGGKKFKKHFKSIERPFGYYYFGSGNKRLLAMLVDFMFISPILVSINIIIDNVNYYGINQHQSFNIYLLFGLYAIWAWGFESSRLQATPGKKMFGLKVITRKQDRVGYLQGLGRVALFSVSSFGLFLTAFINSWTGGHFIHDRLSSTHVMDVWRSRKEEKKKKRYR